MIKFFLLFVSAIYPFILGAQHSDKHSEKVIDKYTYVEDLEFVNESDFYGYTFVPYEGKMSTAHYPDPIRPGIVSFTITSHDVIILERARYTPAGIVDPPTDEKPYSLHISSINKTDDGFEISLVDMRRRDLIGFLRFYRDNISQVDLIKYRPSMADPEHIYLIKNTPKNEHEEYSTYFTHEQDFDARTLDELWGKSVYPFVFFENYSDIDNRKISRIYPTDGIHIKFEERTVIRNKKEKILQYMILTDPIADKTMELLLRKMKETEISTETGPRTVLELEMHDEVRQRDYIVTLHRGVKSMLKSIEIKDVAKNQSNCYEMRRGKSVIK